MKNSYKIVTYAEWELNYKEDYPFARVSSDLKEVVLSCEGKGIGNMTKDEALDHIANLWPIVEQTEEELESLSYETVEP